jgi:hypothetical protein
MSSNFQFFQKNYLKQDNPIPEQTSPEQTSPEQTISEQTISEQTISEQTVDLFKKVKKDLGALYQTATTLKDTLARQGSSPKHIENYTTITNGIFKALTKLDTLANPTDSNEKSERIANKV